MQKNKTSYSKFSCDFIHQKSVIFFPETIILPLCAVFGFKFTAVDYLTYMSRVSMFRNIEDVI